MVFGSVSYREIEAPKADKMNRSQQSSVMQKIPPVQIQNLNRPNPKQQTAPITNNSSSFENYSIPNSGSEKILDYNILPSVLPHLQPQPLQGKSHTRTPDPVMIETRPARSVSQQASIYKHLHKHKNLTLGIGVQNVRDVAISEEEDQDEDQVVGEESKQEVSDFDADSNEDFSEEEEDSRQEDLSLQSPVNAIQQAKNMLLSQDVERATPSHSQTGDLVSQRSEPRGEGEESDMLSPPSQLSLANI